MIDEAHIERVREALWPSQGRVGWSVYALLDGARDERIQDAVKSSELPHACLYAGALPAAMAAVAPYIVRLTKEAPFTRALLRDGWGQSWGIFVLATATLEELRRHFRRFLKVRDERGKTLIFRYYDPRVMRVYLPTCNAGELAAVFGPAGMFVVEGDRGEIQRFHRSNAGLGVESMPLAL